MQPKILKKATDKRLWAEAMKFACIISSYCSKASNTGGTPPYEKWHAFAGKLTCTANISRYLGTLEHLSGTARWNSGYEMRVSRVGFKAPERGLEFTRPDDKRNVVHSGVACPPEVQRVQHLMNAPRVSR